MYVLHAITIQLNPTPVHTSPNHPHCLGFVWDHGQDTAEHFNLRLKVSRLRQFWFLTTEFMFSCLRVKHINKTQENKTLKCLCPGL